MLNNGIIKRADIFSAFFLFVKERENMKIDLRCLPYGALPYESIDSTKRMMLKLFEQNPFLPFLPNISNEDTLLGRTFFNIPGVKIKEKKVVFKVGSTSYKQGILKLDKAYNFSDIEDLEPFAIESPFLDMFLKIIKKFKSKRAYINLLGPFTISQILNKTAEEQVLMDKSYRKLFVQAVCVKALWIIEKIREVSPETVPVIILEEPMLCQFGMLKRENENLTVELVTNLFSRTIEKIKASGALVAVHSMEKCDWQIPINAGVDIISFDAYNNPNNISIIPEMITDFIKRGGKINWAIVPVMTESIVKGLNIDYVANRLFATMEGLILSGVPERFVYNSALVSVQGDINKLPIIFSEKALILSTQLAKRIPIKY